MLRGGYTQAGQSYTRLLKGPHGARFLEALDLMLKGIRQNPYWTGVGGTLGVTSGILPLTAMVSRVIKQEKYLGLQKQLIRPYGIKLMIKINI